MKRYAVILVLVVACLAAAGAVYAAEMSGTVTAMDTAKNTITVKGDKMEAGFDCETGTLMKGVKVGDMVTVEYTEAGKMKKATKISPMQHSMPAKKKAPVGC